MEVKIKVKVLIDCLNKLIWLVGKTIVDGSDAAAFPMGGNHELSLT